ncbi:hypothetical protein [Bacillus massiliigorillae]|uniref:UPF0738 family protein n=1 Tax=Bacillus massiliigorillae TaxID=1243664 RepID=UPI0005A5F0C1|nr:hypothetical protein [Bacillus massiliigorillae]
MRKEIQVKSTINELNKLIIKCDRPSLADIKPKGQMLVDSDQFAFVYIVECENEYMYLSLPENTWPELNEVCKHQSPVVLSNDVEEIELPQFVEELLYLIDNIKDNANYGEEMGLKVEKVFL